MDFFTEVVEGEAGEIGDQDPTRTLIGVEVIDVVEGLSGGAAFPGGEILAGGLHLDREFSAPEEIHAAVTAALAFDVVLELGIHGAAITAEDSEKFVEERFGFGFFALWTDPAFREGEGA